MTTTDNSGVKIKQSNDWGTGFYLLHYGNEAFYSQNDYSRASTGLIDLADNLLEIDNNTTLVDHTANDNSRSSSEGITIDILKEGPLSPNYKDDMMSLLDEIQYLLNDDSVKYRINFEGSILNKTFQSSYTENIIQKYSIVYITIEYFSNKWSNNTYLFDVFGGIISQDINLDYIRHKIENSIERLKILNNAKSIKSGKYPLILSPDTAYSLTHESIGHGTEADQVINGDSFLSNKMGRKVASTEVTIVDDPHIRGTGWAEFDDEGTKTKGTTLVEEGVLVDFLHTRKTAQVLDSTNTGNARSSSYLTPPSPRQSNIFLEPRDYNIEELIEDVDYGVYLGATLSANTSIYSGQIMIETQYGYLIENGEKTQILGPTLLSGNSIEILANVDKIGSTIEKFPTHCLKANNKLSIGAYAPHLSLTTGLLQ